MAGAQDTRLAGGGGGGRVTIPKATASSGSARNLTPLVTGESWMEDWDGHKGWVDEAVGD